MGEVHELVLRAGRVDDEAILNGFEWMVGVGILCGFARLPFQLAGLSHR